MKRAPKNYDTTIARIAGNILSGKKSNQILRTGPTLLTEGDRLDVMGNKLLDACGPIREDPPAVRDSPVPLSGVSLLELLRFYAQAYMRLNDYLEGLEADLNGDEIGQTSGDAEVQLTGKRLKLELARAEQAAEVLGFCTNLCERINLQVCMKHVDELKSAVREGWLGAEDVRGLKANVQREISCHYFVGIPSARIELFKDGRNGWEDIASAFPNAIDDIEEMNKCFALCRYPSAVMHSLLAVEHGLVALGPRIGATDPKEGWDATCRQLEKVIKAGRDANTTGLDFNQLDQLNAGIQAMKLAWRNKINHATGKPVMMHGGFAPDVAEEIMQASRGFMRRLKIVLGL